MFHFPDGREKTLPVNSPVLFYLQRLRDEVAPLRHRRAPRQAQPRDHRLAARRDPRHRPGAQARAAAALRHGGEGAGGGARGPAARAGRQRGGGAGGLRFLSPERVSGACRMSIDIALAETRDEIAATWPVMHQLRPHLDAEAYLAQVLRLQAERDFRLARMTVDGDGRRGGRVAVRRMAARRPLPRDRGLRDRRGMPLARVRRRSSSTGSRRSGARRGAGICACFRACSARRRTASIAARAWASTPTTSRSTCDRGLARFRFRATDEWPPLATAMLPQVEWHEGEHDLTANGAALLLPDLDAQRLRRRRSAIPVVHRQRRDPPAGRVFRQARESLSMR